MHVSGLWNDSKIVTTGKQINITMSYVATFVTRTAQIFNTNLSRRIALLTE